MNKTTRRVLATDTVLSRGTKTTIPDNNKVLSESSNMKAKLTVTVK